MMENPKTPETLETQIPTDNTLDEALGSSGLSGLGEKSTGSGSAEEIRRGALDMNNDASIACDREITNGGDDENEDKMDSMDVETVLGVQENRIGDFEAEKGSLVNDAVGEDNEGKLESAERGLDSDLKNMAHDGVEEAVKKHDDKVDYIEDSIGDLEAKKGGLVDDSVGEDNKSKVESVEGQLDSDLGDLACDGNEEALIGKIEKDEEMEEIFFGSNDSVKKIEISRVYVDFSGSLGRDNLENVDGLKGVGLSLNEDLKEAGKKEKEKEAVADNQVCQFSVGDVVWVNTKNDTWWPGKIYDPSDAPESALKSNQADCLFVGYCGSSQVAWCSPSQLKPFYNNFKLMSEKNNARKFNVAVEKAVNEFGKQLRSEMACSCIEKKCRELADNSGNTEVASLPERICGEIGRSFITKFEPEKFLEKLKYLALGSSMPGMLDFAVSLSCLPTFYSSIGHLQVPMHQLRGVTNDEDCAGDNFMVTSKNVVEIADNNLGQAKKNLKTEKNDEGSQLKKDEALAMILGEDSSIVPGNCRGNAAEEGTLFEKSTSNFRKRKRKKDYASALASRATPKETSPVGLSATAEFSGVGSEVDQIASNIEKGFELRERKKSKYLSYPYVNWEKSFLSEAEDHKPPGVAHADLEQTGAGQFVVSPSVVKGSGKRFQKLWFRKFISESDIAANPALKNAPSAELLSQLSLTAIDCFYPKETERFDLIEWFFSRFRISAYHDESIYETYCKNLVGQKQSYVKPGVNEKPDKFIGKDRQGTVQPAPGIESEQKMQKRKRNANSVRSKLKSLSGLSDVKKIIGTSSFSDKDFQSLGTFTPDKGGSEQKDKKEDCETPLDLQSEQTTGIPDLNGSGATTLALAANSQVVGHVGSETKKRKGKGGDAFGTSETKITAGVQDLNGSSAKAGSLVVDFQVEGPYSINSVLEHNNGKSPVPMVLTKDSVRGGTLSDEAKPEKKRRKRKAPSRNPETMPAAGIPDLNGTSTEPGASPLAKPERKRRKREPDRAILFMTFAPGDPKPSTDDLLAIFTRFKPLEASVSDTVEQSETQSLNGSRNAKVVFMRSADAQQAVRSLQTSNPFGGTLLSCHISLVEESMVPAKLAKSVSQPVEAPPLDFIRQNLEMMTSMLKNSGDNLSPEMKAKLENEIKVLLERVTAMPSTSPS